MNKDLQNQSDINYSLFRFLFIFAVGVIVFYIFTFSPFFKNFFPTYLSFQANLSHIILNILGQNTTLNGVSISTEEFAIQFVWGCDGLEPTALFIAAILAFPAPLRLKIAGILIGSLSLLFLNIVRVICLFLIGVYYPNIFDVMHLEIWQMIFIFLALIFFMIWLKWVIQDRKLSMKNVTT